MVIAAAAATLLVALLHTWFLVLEMFLWTKPIGRKTFATTAEFAEASEDLAKNQGLYNGFLVAGLLLGVFWPEADIAHAFRMYSLGCVIVAGIYGAATVSPKIFVVQSVPAIVALGLSCYPG